MSMINNYERLIYALTVVAVLLSSMVGGEIFGVSLGKIAILPLIIALMPKIINNICVLKITKGQKKLFFWLLCIIVSSSIGIIRDVTNELTTQMLLNITQIIFFYIPLIIGLRSINEKSLFFKKAIVLTATINSVWAIIQYIQWILFGIDFNNFIFNDILKGFLGTYWTAYYNNGVFITVRATGLTHDPSIFALFVLFGFAFTKNTFLRIIMFISVLFSQSRSGLIAIFIFLIAHYFIGNPTRIKKKTIQRVLIGLVISVLGIFFFSDKIYILLDIINNIYERFLNLFSKDNQSIDGSNRHLLYFPIAILIWLFDYNLIFKLLGKGFRGSGMVLIDSKYCSDLGLGMDSYFPWSIECDFAENLLGLGLVGSYCWYSMNFRLYKSSSDKVIKALIISLLCFGIMYNYSFLTIVSLFFVYML